MLIHIHLLSLAEYELLATCKILQYLHPYSLVGIWLLRNTKLGVGGVGFNHASLAGNGLS